MNAPEAEEIEHATDPRAQPLKHGGDLEKQYSSKEAASLPVGSQGHLTSPSPHFVSNGPLSILESS
jgi:hypothetical protein